MPGSAVSQRAYARCWCFSRSETPGGGTCCALRGFMLDRIYDALVPLILWPVQLYFRSRAATQAADIVTELSRRIEQAEADGLPELARQLREHAATFSITPPD